MVKKDTERLLDAEQVPEPPRDWIDDMVGAICDPIIVYPNTGWEDTLPEPIKDRLKMDRLIHLMRCGKGEASYDEACDTDALLYMYPATMQAPLSHDWTQIYLYLGYKVMGDKMPEDVAQKTLDKYEMGKLQDLKSWIHRKHVEHRRARRRQEKAESSARPAQAAPVEAEYEQMKML